MAGAEAERVGTVVGSKGAVALEGAEQRADVTLEAHIVERDVAATCRVGKHDAAMGYRQAVDADPIGIEPERLDRCFDLAAAVQPHRRRDPVETELVDPEVAPHQRGGLELHGELASGNRGCSGRADRDAFEAQRRGRQQAQRHRTGNMDRRADDFGRLRLDRRAKAVPIDEKRPDQRRPQGQDDGDANTK